MTRRLIVPGLLAAAVAVLVAGSDPPSAAGGQKKKTKFESVEAIAANAGITADTPGVAIRVVNAKGQPTDHFFGKTDLKANTPFTSSITCELGSCSKPFTALAVLILADRGKLDLNDPVRKYIPELPVYHRDRPLQIHHLLQHTGGLPNYFSFDDFPSKSGKYWTNEDYVPQFAKQQAKHPAVFAPGEKYEYSNTGYLLLAVIVARVSGQSFGEFMRDNLFGPLKMTRSFIHETPDAPRKLPKEKADRAVGYMPKKKDGSWRETWSCPPRMEVSNLVIGDGGVWSSLDDLLKFDRAMRDRAVLKPDTWAKALAPSNTRDGKTNEYGMGWGLDLDDKKKAVGFGHNGSWGGFKTRYWLDLEKNRTVILLSNRDDISPAGFAGQLERFLDR